MTGPALGYLVGAEALRNESRRRWGTASNLPAFHGAVREPGAVSLPMLRESVEARIAEDRRRGR